MLLADKRCAECFEFNALKMLFKLLAEVEKLQLSLIDFIQEELSVFPCLTPFIDSCWFVTLLVMQKASGCRNHIIQKRC